MSDWEATGRVRYRINFLGGVVLVVEEKQVKDMDALYVTRWRDARQKDMHMSVAVPRSSSRIIPWNDDIKRLKEGGG